MHYPPLLHYFFSLENLVFINQLKQGADNKLDQHLY